MYIFFEGTFSIFYLKKDLLQRYCDTVCSVSYISQFVFTKKTGLPLADCYNVETAFLLLKSRPGASRVGEYPST